MALRMLTCLEGMEMFSQIQSTTHPWNNIGENKWEGKEGNISVMRYLLVSFEDIEGAASLQPVPFSLEKEIVCSS